MQQVVTTAKSTDNPPLTLQEWLSEQKAERDALIMRLRRIEANLVRYGWLKRESLPKRRR